MTKEEFVKRMTKKLSKWSEYWDKKQEEEGKEWWPDELDSESDWLEQLEFHS